MIVKLKSLIKGVKGMVESQIKEAVVSKHNWVKARSLYALSLLPEGRIVTVSRVAKATGCSKASLSVLLPKWVRWGYCQRERREVGVRLVWYYRLTERGRAYLGRMPSWYSGWAEAIKGIGD